MRWFKHFSDNHRGRSQIYMHDNLGYFGPFFYYLIYEMCAEKIEEKPVGSHSVDSFTFRFHQRVVCSAARAKLSTVLRALDAGQSCEIWTYTRDGSEIEVKVPIMLNLLDRDLKKPRSNRANVARKPRSDKDKDKDTDKDVDKELRKAIWCAYKESFNARYKTEPVRNAAVNSKVSQIAKRLGQDGIEVVKFFLTHNDSYYLKQVHAIGACLKDAEALHTQWSRGRAITGADVRAFEKNSEYQAQWERLGKEET